MIKSKFLQLHLSIVLKIPLKNSWIRTVIRISTKIELFVASETSHALFIRIQRQLLELSAYFIELPLSRNGKNSFKISCIRIANRIATKI